MTRLAPACCAALLLSGSLCAQGWPQWGQNPAHTGAAPVVAQRPQRILAQFKYDSLSDAMRRDTGGDLLVHYMAPLVDGPDVFIMSRGASTWVSCRDSAPPCGNARWPVMQWGVTKLTWEQPGNTGPLRTTDRQLREQWTTVSRWTPPPAIPSGWEPVFHPALTPNFIYLPCEAGTVMKVNRATGAVIEILQPFAAKDPNRYIASPLTVDASGSLFYTVLQFAPAAPWSQDVAGAWLVKIDSTGRSKLTAFSDLVPAAPSLCATTFAASQLPWPPSPDSRPPLAACGSQRPGLNVAPAIAPDGTVYVVSRAHLNSAYAYLIAVTSDLRLKWSASLRDRLSDGCEVLLPPSGTLGGCRAGARRGVDPATNDLPAGSVADESTSSPVVAPDGSIYYGAYTRYNYSRGHLFHFSAAGAYIDSYDFGWDITPSIYAHDGTWSLGIKDNQYPVGSYCGVPGYCGQAEARYRLTSLTPDLKPEWTFVNTTDRLCTRQPDGAFSCEPHEPGFEWCVNMVAVDAQGTVYANSEDGSVYAIGHNGKLLGQNFLQAAIGAAYTPLAIGEDGTVYTQNDGVLFAVGERTRRLVPPLPR